MSSSLNEFAAGRRELDPDFFSLRVRQALHGSTEPEEFADNAPSRVGEPGEDFLMEEEFTSLASHPEVIEAGARVVEAEAAVLAAEDAGVTDELAMRRLDRARAVEREVLVRLQLRRTVGHTDRAVSRVAQVVPLRPRLVVLAGGEAA